MNTVLIIIWLMAHCRAQTSLKSKTKGYCLSQNRKVLEQLGDTIKLACKRGRYTRVLLSQRTGLRRLAMRNQLFTHVAKRQSVYTATRWRYCVLPLVIFVSDELPLGPAFMGWTMGLEPTTAGITIRHTFPIFTGLKPSFG